MVSFSFFFVIFCSFLSFCLPILGTGGGGARLLLSFFCLLIINLSFFSFSFFLPFFGTGGARLVGGGLLFSSTGFGFDVGRAMGGGTACC